jgi:uncharacterized protein YndB with AHSA1/START domain
MEKGKTVHKTIQINAPALVVWQAITNPELITQWFSADAEILFVTTWQPGSPLHLQGMWNNVPLDDKGTILAFEEGQILAYTWFSKFWRLPDEPEYYSTVQYRLEAAGDETTLFFTNSNLVTEAVYGHINYFWLLTLHRLKTFVENEIVR